MQTLKMECGVRWDITIIGIVYIGTEGTGVVRAGAVSQLIRQISQIGIGEEVP